jgi:hypothetical protein
MQERNTRPGRRLLARACALGLCLATGAAYADDADFDWLGIAYLWAADIQVDSRDASASIDFNDVLDKLEMGFQTHVEVQGDDLGGFIDFTFLGIGDNASRPAADFHADLDMTLMDLALVWSPGTERMTGFELFGGLRYLDTDFRLVVDPVPPGPPDAETRVNDTYADLLFGARYITPLNDRWRLTFSGDVSGGDTEGTWSAGAFAGYVTGRHRFIAGYRHMEIDVKAAGSKATETMSGPVVAYGFSF